MRWEAQTPRSGNGREREEPGTPAGAPSPLPFPGLQRGDEALPGLDVPGPGESRPVRMPGFAGMTFHEVRARSVLNAVPASSHMPFRWTVNPYRGCSHACVYCYARGTHQYLDLDAGADFDQQIVVKTNAPAVLRAELSRPTWTRETVALGTNTDPYQRAEGHYRLMPGIIAALADTGTPFSLLTKGTLVARDVPLLREASRAVPVQVALSLAVLDPALAAAVEPGTPSPTARLRLIERLAAAGAEVTVMAMPLLPWLTDGDEHIDSLMGAVAGAGARRVMAGALHLRPGAREWYLAWIDREHPHLAEGYRRMYARSSYAPESYRRTLAETTRAAAARHGLRHGGAHGVRRDDGPAVRTNGRRAVERTAPARAAGHARPAPQPAPDVQPALF